MNKVVKVLRGYKPLVYGPFGILLSKGLGIYVSDNELESIKFLGKVQSGFLGILCQASRLLSRLLRMEIGPAILLPCERRALFSVRGEMHIVDIETGAISAEGSIGRGKRPLSYAMVDYEGFDKGIYFGEYLGNAAKGPVSIFHRNMDGDWKKIYTFKDGEINHIHALVPDPERKLIYVLTGDFEESAAIWVAKNNFQTVEKLISDGQQSRACWLMREGDSLLYATDTQLEINHVNSAHMSDDGKILKIQKHFPINGSSIYAYHNHDKNVVFSSSVEPNPNPSNIIYSLLERKTGNGIVGNSACIYSGSLEEGFSILLSAEKDFWPPRLFQFGTFTFPAGCSSTSELIHAYGVALSGYDNCTVLLKNQLN